MSHLVEVYAPEDPEEAGSGCEAMLLFWYVGEGDPVTAEQDLAEIETAKAVVVLKAPATGVLQEVVVREGDPVRPAQKLAVVRCDA